MYIDDTILKKVAIDIIKSKAIFFELTKYNDLNENLSKFYYLNNKIYYDIYSIDVKSFNMNFLKYINSFINSDTINEFIYTLHTMDKSLRVILFGKLYKEVSKTFHLTPYLISYRNLLFYNIFLAFKNSSRSYDLYRMNVDDIEFSTTNEVKKEIYIDETFHDIIKINRYDNVIVLNKSDGLFYLNNNKIVNIKYTSGWVNIPAYRYMTSTICNFLLNDETLKDLMYKLYDYIENSNDEDFIGEEDELSEYCSNLDIITLSTKRMFISKVMSKFNILF